MILLCLELSVSMLTPISALMPRMSFFCFKMPKVRNAHRELSVRVLRKLSWREIQNLELTALLTGTGSAMPGEIHPFDPSALRFMAPTFVDAEHTFVACISALLMTDVRGLHQQTEHVTHAYGLSV